MKKNIIRKCILISFIAVAIMFVASTFVTYWVSRDNIKTNLMMDAEFYAKILSSAGEESLNGLTYNGNLRLTVLKASGEVLFESDTSEGLENHSDREEIKFAKDGNPKVVERYSKTLNKRMFYYAIMVGSGQDAMVVRLASFSGEIWSYFLKSLPFVVVAMAVAFVISYFFARSLSREVTGQIKNIQDGLQGVNNGNYRGIPTTMADKEIYAVVREIDRLFLTANRQLLRIKEEEAKLDYVVNHLNEGVIALSTKGEILLLNSAANRLFEGDGKAKNLGYLIDDNALLARLTALVARGASETFSAIVQNKDLVFTLLSGCEGANVATIIFIADVTKERLAVRERGEFFQNASHELKTPLTSIEGLSELLLTKTELPPQLQKFAERIHSEATRMSYLVQDMLYISDLENNRRPDEEEAINLSALATEVFEGFKAECLAKSIQLQVVGEAELTLARRNVSELLTNLVGNAVHYNKEGGSVKVLLEQTCQTVKIKVIDTGIGISAKDLPRITERFYRADKSRSKQTGGTGLGLAIVKHIVERYKGDLTIESQEGKGTTVAVVFYRGVPKAEGGQKSE